MNEELRLSRVITCEKHKQPIVSICVAPECFNFRELCTDCIGDDIHHAKMHLPRTEAFQKIQRTLETLFKGLKALRKKIIHAMDAKFSHLTVMSEIELKLDQLKRLLNSKIENFHKELSKIYEKNVKQKLNELFFAVEKSYEFLEEEKIKLIKSEKLKPFFVNDLHHDLEYYESYLEEVLEKNVRKFKTGFNEDNVLKLLVSFEQNLKEIFRFEELPTLTPKPHLLYSTPKNHYILELGQNGYLNRSELNFIENHHRWIGLLPSVFYSPKDCFYAFGDSNKESNKIRRLINNEESQEMKDMVIKMNTKRMNFGICLFNDEIYIVGGENSKEGCLSKCEKFSPSDGKVYIVNSLHQKSSQHTIIAYKNKFILKFGGSNIMSSILQVHHERYQPLSPEIYSAETEEWSLVETSSRGFRDRIDFGLWPGIFCSSVKDKIILIEGELFQVTSSKSKFEIKLEFYKKEIKELKITKEKLDMSSRNLLFSQCCLDTFEGLINFAVMDENRNGIFYVASIPI